MSRILFAAALALVALPAPVLAQEAEPVAAPLAEFGDQMRDPAQQRETALMAQALAEIALDMPIAPLARAAAELAGDQAADIDPDLTLRKLVPGAGQASEALGRSLPQAMAAAGAMAEAAAEMAPQLRALAGRMRALMPPRD